MIELSLDLLDVAPAAGSVLAPGELTAEDSTFADLIGRAVEGDTLDGDNLEGVDDASDAQDALQSVPQWPGVLQPWFPKPVATPEQKATEKSDGDDVKANVSPQDSEDANDNMIVVVDTPVVLALPAIQLVEVKTTPDVAVSEGDTNRLEIAERLDVASPPSNMSSAPAGKAQPPAVADTSSKPRAILSSRVEDEPAERMDRGSLLPTAAVQRSLPESQATTTPTQATTPQSNAVLEPGAATQPGVDGPVPDAVASEQAQGPATQIASSPAHIERQASSSSQLAAVTAPANTPKESTRVDDAPAPSASSPSMSTQAQALAGALAAGGGGHDAAGDGAREGDNPREHEHRLPSPQEITTVAARALGAESAALSATVTGGGATEVVNAVLSQENARAVLDQLVQAFRVQFRNGVGEAVVKLKPEHLGEVTIALRLDRGMVSANVQAESPAVRQWLESQETTVRQALAQHGLNLERFVVDRDRESRHEKPQDQQANRQRRRRQPANDAETPRFEITV